MAPAPSRARPPRTGPVRLVVLNYNGGEHVVRALRCLRDLDWPADQLELICVDNGSWDGSVEAIRAELPEVEVRQVGHNAGFPANNRALTDLEGVRYVGLVNNDAFVEPGWLAPLVAALDERPDLGAVSSKMLLAPRFAEVGIEAPTFDPGPGDARQLGVMVRGVEVEGHDQWGQAHLGDGGWGRESDIHGTFEWSAPMATLRLPAPEGTDGPFAAVVTLEARRPTRVVLRAGGAPVEVEVGTRPTRVAITVDTALVDVLNNVGSKVYEDGAGADIGFLERDTGQHDDPVEVFAWCGGSVLLRPEYLADVGLFDERFFLYYEDTDLSWRGRGRGWAYRTAPTSRVRHLHAASSGEGSEVFAYHVERNRLLMLVKNAPLALVARQVVRYLLVTGSYARRDVVRPVLARRRPRPTVVRRRVGSFVGFLRLLPAMVTERRTLRRRRLVDDDELDRWLVRR